MITRENPILTEPRPPRFELAVRVNPLLEQTQADAEILTTQAQNKTRRRAVRRNMFDAMRVANAAEQIESIPQPGESVHGIMRGNFNSWDLVPATIRLIAPATISDLWIATLGFNRKNSEQLIGLMDDGKIGRVVFICSVYYAAHEPDVCKDLNDQLLARGGRFQAMRSHAKLLLMRTTAGDSLVNESSANLRSCRAIEQFVFTNDLELLNFHAAWMEEATRSKWHHARKR